MKNINIEKLTKEFICDLDYFYELDELIGSSFNDLYPFGNDSIDIDIKTFISENGYVLTEDERIELFDSIYSYQF